eukprot:gene8918-9095_t
MGRPPSPFRVELKEVPSPRLQRTVPDSPVLRSPRAPAADAHQDPRLLYKTAIKVPVPQSPADPSSSWVGDPYLHHHQQEQQEEHHRRHQQERVLGEALAARQHSDASSWLSEQSSSRSSSLESHPSAAESSGGAKATAATAVPDPALPPINCSNNDFDVSRSSASKTFHPEETAGTSVVHGSAGAAVPANSLDACQEGPEASRQYKTQQYRQQQLAQARTPAPHPGRAPSSIRQGAQQQQEQRGRRARMVRPQGSEGGVQVGSQQVLEGGDIGLLGSSCGVRRGAGRGGEVGGAASSESAAGAEDTVEYELELLAIIPGHGKLSGKPVLSEAARGELLDVRALRAQDPEPHLAPGRAQRGVGGWARRHLSLNVRAPWRAGKQGLGWLGLRGCLRGGAGGEGQGGGRGEGG